jgi:hypothetical protein
MNCGSGLQWSFCFGFGPGLSVGYFCFARACTAFAWRLIHDRFVSLEVKANQTMQTAARKAVHWSPLPARRDSTPTARRGILRCTQSAERRTTPFSISLYLGPRNIQCIMNHNRRFMQQSKGSKASCSTPFRTNTRIFYASTLMRGISCEFGDYCAPQRPFLKARTQAIARPCFTPFSIVFAETQTLPSCGNPIPNALSLMEFSQIGIQCVFVQVATRPRQVAMVFVFRFFFICCFFHSFFAICVWFL